MRDKSPKAWEKLVDRLLASPRYGEQWGRHWLDVVRFAESDGYEYDMHRPDAYRYRDYVVQSFNDDKPYDQFVKEQLAGDEIDSKNNTLLVASGFNRLGPLRKNAGNQDVASSQNEVLTEMTNIVGAAFLGVTVGCARCHDHKFDPFRQTDYYRMQAHFAQTAAESTSCSRRKEEQEAWKAKATPVEQEMRKMQSAMRRAPEAEKAKIEMQIEKPGRQDAGAAAGDLHRLGRPEESRSDPRARPGRLSEQGAKSRPAAARRPAAGRRARRAARYREAAAEAGRTGLPIRRIR